MATRVLFCDLRTDRVIDSLPVAGLSWEDWIGKAGTLRGSIAVADASMAARAGRLTDGRTAVWLERDGAVEWGGILWTSTRTPRTGDTAAALAVQCASWESYYDHRILYDTLVADGVDQLDVARALLVYAAGKDGGDIGLEIDFAQTSGVLRDRTYELYDLPRVRDLLDELAAVEDGFEWVIQSFRSDDGARHKALRLGYPQLAAGSSDTVLSMPGPIVDYALPSDATTMANAWQTRGASINSNQAAESRPLMSDLLIYPDMVDAGWPRLDGSSDYTTGEVKATLDAHATADLARARMPQLIPSVTVASGGRPLPPLGGTVRLRITDVWHPDGLNRRYRVVGRKVTTAAAGTPETTSLYLEEVA